MMDRYSRGLHSAFLAGEARTQHCVLGMRLYPMTLWHRRELHRVGCPLEASGEDADWMEDFDSIYLLVGVCARPANTRPGGWKRRMSGLLWRYRRTRALRLWRTHKGRELVLLGGYLGESMEGPIMMPGEGGKPSKLPWWLYVVCLLMARGHYSEREAWAMPMGKAVWMAKTLQHIDGDPLPSLISEEEYRDMPEEYKEEL